MQILDKKLTEIYPYSKNNRKHSEQQITRISESIKQFGTNQPIVIDEENIVLVGHGRLLAAKKLGLETFPCYQIKNLTNTQKKAYRILDNKLQNDSEWDFDFLTDELKELECEGFELKDWGLDKLLDLAPIEENETYEDGAGEISEEPFIKEGDLIELGKHRVLCGDSTNHDQVNELMNNEKINLFVTDPPYGLGNNWNGLQKFRGNKQVENDGDESYSELIESWVNAFKSYSLPSTPFYMWFASNKVVDARSTIEKLGYTVHCIIIWVKDHFNVGRADYHSQYEPCLYFSSGSERYWSGTRSESEVWNAKRLEQERVHPTQKPISLISKSIINSSKPNDLVCDPFLGSGTTLIAADQLDRICYGMELSPAYCQVILERYQKHCEKVGKDCVIKINGELYESTNKTEG